MRFVSINLGMCCCIRANGFDRQHWQAVPYWPFPEASPFCNSFLR